VRSRYAHGVINAVDSEEALALLGVLGIYTGPDLTAADIKPMPLGQAIPTRDGSTMHRPACPVLTSDKVRYVGDPVAIVVAETAAEAARRRRAALRCRHASGPGQDQPARRQRLRRSGLRRLAAGGHERGRRRLVRIRHSPHRHAGDPSQGLAEDP
jgi:xanthine dehydrogenase molybdopterin-binding subunit B